MLLAVTAAPTTPVAAWWWWAAGAILVVAALWIWAWVRPRTGVVTGGTREEIDRRSDAEGEDREAR